MIQDIDATLRKMLAAELAKIPGCPVREEAQITFALPTAADADLDKKARVNLYLHDLRENLALRDEGFEFQRKPGEEGVDIKRGPVRLDISYLVTAYAGDDPTAEHRLLSEVLGVLMRNRVIPEAYLTGTVEAQGTNALQVAVAQPDHPAYSDPPRLWQALGGQLRPALGMVITSLYDPYVTKYTKLVREAVFGFGVGRPPHGPQRPLDMRSVRVSAAGVVVDQVTEQPLAGTMIAIKGREETAQTDAKGFFSFLNLPPGKHTLCFRRRGYGMEEKETTAPPPGRPERLEPMVVALSALDENARIAEEIALAEAGRNVAGLVEVGRAYRISLTGRLRYADGRPAAYIPVRVGRHHTTTDEEGVYCFFDLPSGDHKVVAEIPGIGETEVPRPEGASPQTRSLTLPAIDVEADPSPDSEGNGKTKSKSKIRTV